MHAVLVRVTINDPEPALEFLRNEVVPRTKQAPGFVGGYWMNAGENMGWAVIAFDSEENANAYVEQARGAEGPGHATIDDMSVREIVAHA